MVIEEIMLAGYSAPESKYIVEYCYLILNAILLFYYFNLKYRRKIDMCACPYLFRLGGIRMKSSQKWLLFWENAFKFCQCLKNLL